VPRGTPEGPVRVDGKHAPGSPGLPKVLWLLLIAASLTQGTHGALNAFASIHWQSQGFTDATIGYLWAAGVVAEILVFVLLGQAVGTGSGVGLILIGSAAAAIRFTVMSFHPSLGLTFVLQAMHSLSFGATHLGTMAALAAFSPPGGRGRAQGVYGSLAALVMALSTVASGVIYRAAGATVFAAMAPLGAIGLVLTLIAVRLLRAQPQREGSGG
jgi:PPP family 3-phenylpropionic acid transporter